MQKIVIIVHDMRSTHNVGSLLRTAEGFAVDKIFFTGYTPYPAINIDKRLPHIATKLTKQIHKTALGAENMIEWERKENIFTLIDDLKQQGFLISALEQSNKSIPLQKFNQQKDIAILLGREVEGIDQELLNICDVILEIPMYGKKESFNVVQAAAIAMYQLRLFSY